MYWKVLNSNLFRPTMFWKMKSCSPLVQTTSISWKRLLMILIQCNRQQTWKNSAIFFSSQTLRLTSKAGLYLFLTAIQSFVSCRLCSRRTMTLRQRITTTSPKSSQSSLLCRRYLITQTLARMPFAWLASARRTANLWSVYNFRLFWWSSTSCRNQYKMYRMPLY